MFTCGYSTRFQLDNAHTRFANTHQRYERAFGSSKGGMNSLSPRVPGSGDVEWTHSATYGFNNSDIYNGANLALRGYPCRRAVVDQNQMSPPRGARQPVPYVARPWYPSSKQTLAQAVDAIAARFGSMFKAFQSLDLDHSGTLDKHEIRRGLHLWNLPVDDEQLDALVASCDLDGDGQIAYDEFVDALARDTVTLAAMGKRGQSAMQAMGAADIDPTMLSRPKEAAARLAAEAAAGPLPSSMGIGAARSKRMPKHPVQADASAAPAAAVATRHGNPSTPSHTNIIYSATGEKLGKGGLKGGTETLPQLSPRALKASPRHFYAMLDLDTASPQGGLRTMSQIHYPHHHPPPQLRSPMAHRRTRDEEADYRERIFELWNSFGKPHTAQE